ncbi:MAG: Glutamine transport ATP-binding protein GlnQ [Planctomycetes bacterium ADurb.Bin401]|jgi:putative glutamine transport system ATP-binding protein|nr:MAG: Glutamine transport ATP-binding protein GlnQ [Planctomycetes bacterium ADurb.Bin401]
MIKIENVSYRYPDSETEAISRINVRFPKEHVLAILGQSGSGKTTLLNCIARFLNPTEGEIKIDGQNINSMDKKQFRLTLGVVSQDLNLFPHLTVMGNMTLAPTKALGVPIKQAESDAMAMLKKLSIAELADRYPSQISGGQAQRAAIARGLMLQPRYMLLDEPTSALDTQTTADFAQWLNELHEETSFIIVTHDLFFARQTASHGVFLENGKVQAVGTIQEIIKHQAEAIENNDA